MKNRFNREKGVASPSSSLPKQRNNTEKKLKMTKVLQVIKKIRLRLHSRPQDGHLMTHFLLDLAAPSIHLPHAQHQ
jgi:hypothetical protein